jgi:hypothetical protein
VTAEQVQDWQGPVAAPDTLGMKTLNQLMAEPEKEVTWIVEGLLPAGGTSIVSAKPKVGKSTFERCLAYAIATGGDFLGRKTEQGPVLYLAPQELESEVRKHFQLLGATGNEPIHICCVLPLDFSIAKVKELIIHYKPQLVILDQLMHMIEIHDENKYAQVTRALRPVEAHARESGTHIQMTYHSGKSDKQDAADSVLGSTAFFGSVDTLIIIKRFPEYRTIQSRQRYTNDQGDLPESLLEFEDGAVSLGDARTKMEAVRIAEALLTFVRGRKKEQFTEEELLAKVAGGHALKRTALRQLVGDSKMRRTGKGVRNNPFMYSAR